MTNLANILMPDVLRYMPGTRSLQLCADLEAFLASNLKKSRETQCKLPGLARELCRDEGFDESFPDYSFDR